VEFGSAFGSMVKALYTWFSLGRYIRIASYNIDTGFDSISGKHVTTVRVTFVCDNRVSCDKLVEAWDYFLSNFESFKDFRRVQEALSRVM